MLPVLLAAGLGRRLGGRAKALYPLDGLPLMHRTALGLAAAGFGRMLIVTGHDSESVRRYWQEHDAPLDVEWLHNERYADLNNFYTVAAACELPTDEPLLVVNSDIVVVPETFGLVRDRPEDVVVVIDDSTNDEEAMGVRLADGCAVELSKRVSPEESAGEFIGVSIIGGDAKRRYLDHTEAALTAGEAQLYYEDVYTRMARTEPLGVAVVDAATWAEIDAPEDVPRALEVAERMARRLRVKRLSS